MEAAGKRKKEWMDVKGDLRTMRKNRFEHDAQWPVTNLSDHTTSIRQRLQKRPAHCTGLFCFISLITSKVCVDLESIRQDPPPSWE